MQVSEHRNVMKDCLFNRLKQRKEVLNSVGTIRVCVISLIKKQMTIHSCINFYTSNKYIDKTDSIIFCNQ